MLYSFSCPICDNDDWQAVKEFDYSRSDQLPESLGSWRDYALLRRRVVFEVWFPDSEDVTLWTQYCRVCGFMTCVPRPSVGDIEGKYLFLQTEEKDIGGQDSSEKALKADRRRGDRVYRTIASKVPGKQMTVLDFGGGNGKLLVPFQEQGHTCHLVDYTLSPLPGIQKIGDTLDDVPAAQRYDAILCSHVIEHLGDPRGTVRDLAKYLKDGGVLYGEVPLDMWGGVDLRYDPVTHVNYFTPCSFETLFLREGLTVLKSQTLGGSYNAGRLDVLIILARKSRTASAPRASSKGGDQAARFLNPSLMMRLQRAWRLRRLPTPGAILKRLRSGG